MQPNEMQPRGNKANTPDEGNDSAEQMQENEQGQQNAEDARGNVKGRNVNVQNKPGPEIEEDRKDSSSGNRGLSNDAGKKSNDPGKKR